MDTRQILKFANTNENGVPWWRWCSTICITLTASSDKRNVTVWRPSVCPVFVLTLKGRAAHTQRDSPGVSTRYGQRTFPSEYYEYYLFLSCWWWWWSAMHGAELERNDVLDAGSSTTEWVRSQRHPGPEGGGRRRRHVAEWWTGRPRSRRRLRRPDVRRLPRLRQPDGGLAAGNDAVLPTADVRHRGRPTHLSTAVFQRHRHLGETRSAFNHDNYISWLSALRWNLISSRISKSIWKLRNFILAKLGKVVWISKFCTVWVLKKVLFNRSY